MTQVLCDPELPKDWDEREAQLQRERHAELATREDCWWEPEILQMFRRAALL